MTWSWSSVSGGGIRGKRFAARGGTTALALVALALVLMSAPPAWAQLMLPGATKGAVPSAAPKSAGMGREGRAPAKPIVVKTPADDTVLGHILSFDGFKGKIQFDRAGEGGVALTKLTLPGERLSKPGQACDVDIVPEQPIVATDLGHPAGAQRWAVPVEACPFSIDVLDGAVLVTSARPSCDFPAADCRVNPVGLWGPTAESITPQRIKELEKERVRAETTMRANFHVLLHRAGKDRAAIKAIAGEQAAFSSQREVTCRDYKNEAVHGFCSAQITQARSLAIQAKFADQPDESVHRHPPRHGVKRKPAKPADPVDPVDPVATQWVRPLANQ